MKLWWTQLILNFLVAGALSSAHQIGLAVVVILFFSGHSGFHIHIVGADRVAAWLFVPYAAWVAFASVLNAWIFTLN